MPIYRISAEHFVAGLDTRRYADDHHGQYGIEIVDNAAPIIKYMVGWSIDRVNAYCTLKGWDLEYVPHNGTV